MGNMNGQGNLFLNKEAMTYYKNEDILHLLISQENEASSFELSPNITAELNENGELIGIEILEATSFLRDFILDSLQAKLMNLNIVSNASTF